MVNDYDLIYQAALNMDEGMLQQALSNKHCIDAWKQSRTNYSAASQLAFEGREEITEWLIERGANINYVAKGAAEGGHQSYAENLIRRGASINFVAEGAALGGYHDYSKELLGRGADLVYVTSGAAYSTNRDYIRELLNLGADIDTVIHGVAASGNFNFAEELLKEGGDITFLVHGAAFGGYHEYTDWLLTQRKINTRPLILGAILGGHFDYAQRLLKISNHDDGLNVDMAMTAVCGGHRAYAEKLEFRGSSLDNIIEILSLATENGHRVYAEELLELLESRKPGIGIAIMADAAAKGGHCAHTKDLLNRVNGIVCYHVARGAIAGGHINGNRQNQLLYLSHYPPQWIRRIASGFSTQANAVKVSELVINRAIEISGCIHNRGMSYSQALAWTERDSKSSCEGALFLLMMLISKKPIFSSTNTSPSLSLELWFHIISFVVPKPLSPLELTQLGFFSTLTAMKGQLKFYTAQSRISHKKRGLSFIEEIEQTSNSDELQTIVVEQGQLLQGKAPVQVNNNLPKHQRPIKNHTKDKFHDIIQCWHKHLTGEELPLEESPEISCFVM